jgi:hypothetical protein
MQCDLRMHALAFSDHQGTRRRSQSAPRSNTDTKRPLISGSGHNSKTSQKRSMSTQPSSSMNSPACQGILDSSASTQLQQKREDTRYGKHTEGERLEAKRLQANKRKRARYQEEREAMAARYPIRYRYNAKIKPRQLGTLLDYSKEWTDSSQHSTKSSRTLPP